MARRRTRTRTRTIFRRASSPAPIVVRTTSAPARRSFRRRARSAVAGVASGGLVGHAIGGLLFGFAVKSGFVEKLPAIPIIGRTGTAAILLDQWARRGGGTMVRQAANAAGMLAGYQLATTGAITGLDTMGHGYAGYDPEEDAILDD